MPGPASGRRRRNLSTLDLMLLIGSAGLILGVSQLVWRAFFQGRWVFEILVNGWRGPEVWTGLVVVHYTTDLLFPFLPLAFAWTFLLPALRLRSPRPRWRRLWTEPGMTACWAAVAGWTWGLLGFAAAYALGTYLPGRRRPAFELWVQKFFVEEALLNVGLAVTVVWTVQLISGRWRKTRDAIDGLGRLVGVVWILVAFAWSLREYADFLF